MEGRRITGGATSIADIEEVGRSWGEIERMAQDRKQWRTVFDCLCQGRV